MHFLLLGATGRTGKLVVSELLAQGHTAIALVRPPASTRAPEPRTPGSLSPQPGLTIVTGSPLNKADVKAALKAPAKSAKGQTLRNPPSAAIITLNAVRTSESPFAAPLSPPRFMADSCANTCAVLKEAGIRRVVFMSSAGAGDSWVNMPYISQAFLGLTNISYALKDHTLAEEELQATGDKMDWTVVRCARLVFDAPGTKAATGPASADDVQVLDGPGVGMGMSDGLRNSSAARFLIKVAVEGLYIQKTVVIRNK